MVSAGPVGKASPVEIPALNGFRALAIWFVMLSHVGLERVIPGQFGVTLFFFLSGYLITTLLRREFIRDGSISFKAFYFRRAVRILPPLAFAIGLAVAFSLTGLLYPLYYPGLVTDALFLSNYLPLSGVPIGLWSLAVEEHFYLLFPAIALLCFTTGGARSCAIFCAVACVVTLGVRIFEVSRLEDISNITFWTHTRIDSILFGAMLACWNNPVIDSRDRMPGRWTSYVIGVLLLAVTFIYRDESFRQTVRYSIQGIALFLLFNAAIRDAGFARRILDNKPMKIVALLSYTLYLVHSIMLHVARSWVDTVGFVPAMAGGLAVSFLIAGGVYFVIERPLGAWRRKVERSWRSARDEPPANSEGVQFLATKERPASAELRAESLGHAR